MGCSPSKGKLFGGLDGTGTKNALLDGNANGDCKPVENNQCLKTNEAEKELLLSNKDETPGVDKRSQKASDTTTAKSSEGINKTEMNVKNQERGIEVTQIDKMKKVEKRKKTKGLEKRRRLDKQRNSSVIQMKVDFPPHMVRAHQAAYAYLNPNISKYETLLGLLDQAAQTQLSLQPMMSGLVLRFEEINQALEEMAEEGELMLKEHGEYMAWPSGMLGQSAMLAKPTIDAANAPDPPPDLLQQLLQHSTEKMRLVGSSAQGVGDTTLEEAVECFASLSKLLAQRLQAKQAVERRMVQVLAQVERAVMKKSNPEDSALHSEDSGIGGENESLAGSERHRRHRGSAGSGSCGSGGNIRSTYDIPHNHFASRVGLNEGEEDDEEEDDDEDEEDGEDEYDWPMRKRSNSSPPDPSQPLLQTGAKRKSEVKLKRPMTAATSTKPEYSSSTGYVNILELQKSQQVLDQRIQKMQENWGNRELAGPHYNLYRGGLRRHSLSGSGAGRCAQKRPLKTNQPPCSSPMLEPQPPGRHSVRKLINTFSHGVDGRPGQSLANIPPHIRRPRRSGQTVLPDIGNSAEGSLVINGNNNNNSWPDGRDELDVDSLPPPPPEVLMDNSFQSTEDMTEDEEEAQETSVRGRPMINQRTAVSQRLRTYVHNVTVLPSRPSITQRSTGISPARPIRQDAVMGMQPGQYVEQQLETELDLEKDKSTTLYQQARKIIHLQNATESTIKRNQAGQPVRGERQGSTEIYEAEMSSCSLPVIAPPVSRVRLPPSCPSVHHRFPSPPVFRPQPPSRPPSRSGSPRDFTRPRGNSATEIIPSVSFSDARSVFCRNDQQNSQVWNSPILPRGRLPSRATDNSTRRTQSEQRPCSSSHPEVPKDGGARSTQVKGSEAPGSAITKRPASPLMTENNIQ
ncbi:photoreceptor cilium actin regulator [Myripristis murdjan]|uniref:photoreceptor cilium actin regulator n=1 Tax=Myripristis murdjan TaxID=586833 RepID=UPI0011762BDE|nr:photoreceptor cilium actin regulator-like [Myripristis murdjan]